MKNAESLINELRGEYLNLTQDIAKAEFADATLPFDKTEHENMRAQIEYMKKYAEVVKLRAEYARTKQNQEEEKLPQLDLNPFG